MIGEVIGKNTDAQHRYPSNWLHSQVRIFLLRWNSGFGAVCYQRYASNDDGEKPFHLGATVALEEAVLPPEDDELLMTVLGMPRILTVVSTSLHPVEPVTCIHHVDEHSR